MAKNTKAKASFEDVSVSDTTVVENAVENVEEVKTSKELVNDDHTNDVIIPAEDTRKEVVSPFVEKKTKQGEIYMEKLTIEGRFVTFGAARPLGDRKCQWDMVGEGDDKMPIDDDKWQPLPGYKAKYVRHTILNFQKKPLDVFLVKTRTEIQFWVID